LEPEEKLFDAWESGVALGNAWWDFADNENKKLFRERRDEGRDFHLEIQYSLEIDLLARLEGGELQAYGIEKGSDVGPIPIARYYFSKTAKLDYVNDTVIALGKKFYEVRVQGKREPTDETRPSERELSIPPGVMIDPYDLKGPWRLESPEETFPSEPNEITDRREPEPTYELPSNEGSPSRDLGRPSKSAEIERAIDILLTNGVALAKMARPKAYRAVRECAARVLKSDTQIGFSDPVIQRSLFKRFGPRR
jgi:hypothetical protein